jgi:uncharacterized protein
MDDRPHGNTDSDLARRSAEAEVCMQPVGVIKQLARFPVKSMAGESLPAASLTLQGVPEDRRYAFVQSSSRSAFPWLTARELPELLRYTPVVQQESAEAVSVTVRTPDGKIFPVTSAELREELESLSGRALFLLHDGRGSYDAAPVSLISRQTVMQIADESGTQAEPWRFRPNLLIELDGDSAFEEQKWVGRILRIGKVARIAVTENDQRCMMITLDPASARPSAAILRCVTQQHQQCAGVYGTVLHAGEVQPGDVVALET